MNTQTISPSSIQIKKNGLFTKLAEWIGKHQVSAFFLITFAITWGLGFSYNELIKKGQFLLAPLVMAATCGPALAGIIITALANTQPREGSKRSFWIAFCVAWVVSTAVFLAHNTFINHAPFSPVMVAFTLISVLPVAFVVSLAYSRLPAMRSYLSSLVRLRRVWGWALLALGLPAALILLSVLLSSLLGRQSITAYRFQDTGLALAGLVTVKFLYQFFFFNATGEEAGWRGFALPRLQAQTNPLIAGLILAIFWAPWHFFLWQAEGAPVLTLQYWIQTYIDLIPPALVLVWIYNRSKGSILVAGVFHAAANTAFAFFLKLDYPVYSVILGIFVLVMILTDRMWKKVPTDHPAVYRTPALDGLQSKPISE